MKVSICDGHRTFGEGLSALLASRGHSVVGCAVSTSEAIAAARNCIPDVVVTELHVRDCDCHEVVGRIRSAFPYLPLVVLTGERAVQQLKVALRSGADGIVFKTEGVHELERMMNRVGVSRCATGEEAKGQARVAMSQRVLAAHTRPTSTRRVGITPRGRAVVELLALGKDTAGIARLMEITPATVRTHLQNLFEQLGVHSRVELIAVAVRQGLVEPQPPLPGLESTQARSAAHHRDDLLLEWDGSPRVPVHVGAGVGPN